MPLLHPPHAQPGTALPLLPQGGAVLAGDAQGQRGSPHPNVDPVLCLAWSCPCGTGLHRGDTGRASEGGKPAAWHACNVPASHKAALSRKPLLLVGTLPGPPAKAAAVQTAAFPPHPSGPAQPTAGEPLPARKCHPTKVGSMASRHLPRVAFPGQKLLLHGPSPPTAPPHGFLGGHLKFGATSLPGPMASSITPFDRQESQGRICTPAQP